MLPVGWRGQGAQQRTKYMSVNGSSGGGDGIDVMWVAVMYAGDVAQGAAETATAHRRHSVPTRRRLLRGSGGAHCMAACM